MPFIVKTLEKDFEIEVVGTKFNVSSYPSDDAILTVLTEGEVHIKREMNLFQSKRTKLRPGELAHWKKSDKSVGVRKVDTDDYILWVAGILQFKSLSVREVAKKIERYYNVDILIDQAKVNGVRISGKLDLHDDIEKTMETFAMVSALEHHKTTHNEYIMK